jgi:hypothetical protein
MIGIMSSDMNFNLESILLSCPFSESCMLPKNQSLCRFPEYKLCPDYDSKLQKLKANSKILY